MFVTRLPKTAEEVVEILERLRKRGADKRDEKGEAYWHGLLHSFGQNNPVYRRCPFC